MVLSLSLSLGLIQAGPFTQLEAAYPWGDQLCSEPTPDNTRLFVAPGAAISVLDVTTLPAVTQPTVLARIEVPECAPLSMRYHEMPGDSGTLRRLFMAGGTLGLWELDLCASLFAGTPQECASYPRALVDQIGQTQEWLRCVDVDVVTGNSAAGTPLLFGLFASRADSTPAGPTQLKAYALNSNGTISAYASLVFPAASATMKPLAAGRALAVDPADPDHIYVALGRGGVWRVDIGGATFGASALTVPACPLTVNCAEGEEVRDLDIVATTTHGSVLYAALEYGRLAEYRLASGPSPTPAVIPLACTSGCAPSGNAICSVIDRVTVAEAHDGRLLIFAGADDRPSITSDTRAPYRITGIWSDHCLKTGIDDPNGLAPSSLCRRVFFLRRDVAASLTEQFEGHSYGEYWGTLELQTLDATHFRLYETTNQFATSVREIEVPLLSGTNAAMGPIQLDDTPKIELVATHVDWAFPAADGDVSTLNPSMTLFTFDGTGLTELPATMISIQSSPTWDLLPVPATLGLCGDVTLPAGNCGEPNPYFSASVFGCAHWPDPDAPTSREIFFAGNKSVVRTMPPSCLTPATSQCGDPCTMTPRPSWREQKFSPPISGVDPSIVGWRYQSFDVSVWPPPTSVPQLPPDMRWSQIPAPTLTPEERNDNVDYVSSERPVGHDVVFVTRSGAHKGFKGFKPSELSTLAPASSCAPNHGHGERLPEDGWPQWFEALTHIEREDPGTGDPLHRCKIGVPCQIDGATNRFLINTRCKTYTVEFEGRTRLITIVASGHVAAVPQTPGQPSTCQWDVYGGKGELVIYETTDSAATFAPPTLLRVALGPDSVTPNGSEYGSFWAVDVKTYPPEFGIGEAKSYAFVADFFGHVYVFDVSPSQLFVPATTLPYFPHNATQPANPILKPICSIDFAPEPADGLAPNCIDLEIDGDYAYAALAKGGVAILNISADPAVSTPQVHDVIDTPGMAFAVLFRRVAGTATHMLVGDTRAGVRMYRRAP